ncbi:MAG: N-acetylmuramoyl-L-alanine amidase [Candidatus Binatia bacterium]
MTKNRARARGGDVYERIDVVVVHATAGFATQHAIDTWKTKKASAHWIVPDENEPQHGNFVWAVVGEAKAAFHVGAVDYAPHIGAGPNANNRSLGIEIVNTQNVQNFEDPYSSWQVEATAKIITYAWAKYPNLNHVISHAKLDPTRRDDPGTNFPWSKLEELVLSHAMVPATNPLVTTPHVPNAPAAGASCCVP